jgi:hypothetical protein
MLGVPTFIRQDGLKQPEADQKSSASMRSAELMTSNSAASLWYSAQATVRASREGLNPTSVTTRRHQITFLKSKLLIRPE